MTTGNEDIAVLFLPMFANVLGTDNVVEHGPSPGASLVWVQAAQCRIA